MSVPGGHTLVSEGLGYVVSEFGFDGSIDSLGHEPVEAEQPFIGKSVKDVTLLVIVPGAITVFRVSDEVLEEISDQFVLILSKGQVQLSFPPKLPTHSMSVNP